MIALMTEPSNVDIFPPKSCFRNLNFDQNADFQKGITIHYKLDALAHLCHRCLGHDNIPILRAIQYPKQYLNFIQNIPNIQYFQPNISK